MKKKARSLREELELGFGGGSKLRMFLHLALNPKEAYTKYAIVKATGLRTPSVDDQLKVLLELGWINENSFRPRTFRINAENQIVKLLLEFLKKARYLEP